MSITPGAVSSSHHLATEAGARALRAGGNAIDAAIAAAAALCVVYENNVALGGDLVALVRDPQGKVHFVNATGRAASGETLEALRERHGDELPFRGIDTIPVPGGVRGWEALAELGGRLGWRERLADALAYARDGHPTARSVARAILRNRDLLAADEGASAVFLTDGEPLAEGDPLVQPALARTLEAIAEGGPGAFYEGELARAWVDGLRALGSRISIDDVASYRPRIEEPISLRAFGVEVVTSPPNTQGFGLLRAVRAVEQSGIVDPLGAGAAELARAFAEANMVRARLLSDPEVSGIDARRLMDAEASLDGPSRDVRPTGDTVGLVAVSEDGWAVSLVQSVFKAFGAGILEPRTGVLFQNRGTSFSLDPAHPAVFTPGARPPHTLMPVLVLRGGRLAHAQATMGGQGQAQIHTHLLLRLLAGASAIEATSAPRWVVDSVADGAATAPVIFETDAEATAREALEAGPFDLTIVPPRDEALGHSNVIGVTAEGLDAASDPRSDGSAIIVR